MDYPKEISRFKKGHYFFFLLKAIEKERADLKNESNEVCVEKFF